MKIPAILQPLLETTQRDLPSLMQKLQVGQVLQARVLSQIQPGLIRLQIATDQLLARSQASLPPGARLRLEVTRTGELPELRVLREPAPRDLRLALVRTALARQIPPAELRQQFAALRGSATDPGQARLTQALGSILDRMGLSSRQIDAGRLRQAVANSGILHEARLGGGGSPFASDGKTLLLQLLPRIDSARAKAAAASSEIPGAEQQAAAARQPADALLTRLLRLIEGSVHRVQLHQVSTLPSEDGTRQAWQLDLPIRLPSETHDAMMRIEREPNENDPASTTWSVNLVFDFDTIGTLQCRLAVEGERVATTFWCERPATHDRLESRLAGLREALEAQGLEVVHIANVLGDPPEPLICVPRPDSLLDERV